MLLNPEQNISFLKFIIKVQFNFTSPFPFLQIGAKEIQKLIIDKKTKIAFEMEFDLVECHNITNDLMIDDVKIQIKIPQINKKQVKTKMETKLKVKLGS